jgi:hypothetical protein
MKTAFCKPTTPIPSNRCWSIKNGRLSLKPQNLEPNGRPISRSHSFKSNRNTATQLCLKLCWHAVFHTQEHAASSNGPTIIDRVHSEPDSPAIHHTLRSWSGKLKLRAPPSYGRAFNTSQPVLHECVNQQFLLLLRTPPVCGRVFVARPTNLPNNYYCALHLFVGAYSPTWVFCQQPW